MPMIDVTAAAGTFKKKHDLAQALAECMMRWEKVPPIALAFFLTARWQYRMMIGIGRRRVMRERMLA